MKLHRAADAGSAAVGADATVGAVLTIDVGAIATNWRRLAARAPGAECAAVVKADAYGTGLDTTAAALRKAGCRTFFTALLCEAQRVRKAAPDAVVYVLNGLPKGAAALFADADLRPVLNSVEEIAEWSSFVSSSGLPGCAAVHVDTGMNRLGLTPREAMAWVRQERSFAPGFKLGLLMSHLVASEAPENPVNERQIEIFAALRQAFAGVPASLANSSGIFLGTRAHHEMVRPGYALYGGNPVPGDANPMAPVIRLEARVLQVRSVGRGESVGYHGAWTAPGPRRLATISLGYADGYPARASRNASAIVGGVRCPVAGRISMDTLVLDVTDAPREAAHAGEFVSLLDHEITVDELAAHAGMIGYEVLTQFGHRARRRIIGD